MSQRVKVRGYSQQSRLSWRQRLVVLGILVAELVAIGVLLFLLFYLVWLASVLFREGGSVI